MERPVGDHTDSREDEGTEHRSPESVHFKSLDHSSEEPEEETIDNESKDTKCQEIDRQCQHQKNRFDGHIHYPPQHSQYESRPETFHTNPRYEIRENEKRCRTSQPLDEKHSIVVTIYIFSIALSVNLLYLETRLPSKDKRCKMSELKGYFNI